MEKMPSDFPTDVLQLLSLTTAFYLAELSSTSTSCCSYTFSLQAAYTLLSGISLNHISLKQSSFRTLGKPEDVSYVNMTWFYYSCCFVPHFIQNIISMTAAFSRFLVQAVYDVLPSPGNLHVWGKTETPCCSVQDGDP